MKLTHIKPVIAVMALILLSLSVNYRVNSSLDWLVFTFQVIDLTVIVSEKTQCGFNSEMFRILADFDFYSAIKMVLDY